MANLQWHPGHMAKTKRLLAQNIRAVDVVVEFGDARIPKSSINPDFERLRAAKPRVLAMNKSDLADPLINELWQRHFKTLGITAVFVDCKKGEGLHRLMQQIEQAAKPVIDRDLRKGRKNRAIKVMVAGIPNTGKSTLINRLAGRAAAKTGNKPGITRGNQWIKAKDSLLFLDTPGLLWPKAEDANTRMSLAMTGAIADAAIDSEEVAFFLLKRLVSWYENPMKEIYGFTDQDIKHSDPLSVLAQKKGFLLSGARPDTVRAANWILDNFRAATLGRISLERPEDE